MRSELLAAEGYTAQKPRRNVALLCRTQVCVTGKDSCFVNQRLV